MDADGNPQHPGDMAAQLELALDNLEAIVAAADMTLGRHRPAQRLHHRRRRAVKHWARLTDRFGGADSRFATSCSASTRLSAPQLLVLLEATAVD